MLNHTAYCISIATLQVRVEFADPSWTGQRQFEEQYAAFLVPMEEDAFNVRIHVEKGNAFMDHDPTKTWPVLITRQQARVAFASVNESGWFDLRDRHGELTMRPKGNPENYLRVLWAWLCLETGSLVLHACGIVHRGDGYVFFGPSGSGKSTIAELSPQQCVLSDDLVALKAEKDGYWLYGVPFRGDAPSSSRINASAPLRHLFSLQQANDHRYRRIDNSDSVARVAACVPFVMSDRQSAHKVVRICADLVSQHSVGVLAFRRNPDFWQVIDELE